MTFEMFDLWRRLRATIASMRGSIWEIEARGLHALWRFGCYQSFDEVDTLLAETTGDAAAWAMKCDARMHYNGWSEQEFARLIAIFEQDSDGA
jgi:hypothetical protein